jgi:ParB family transcriptional regulator, chromosome partitioning protein
MANAPIRTKMAPRGLSEDSLQTARAQLTSMLPVIRLPIRGGRMVEFELITIPHGDIATATTVDAENYRDQAFLHAYSLNDIAPSIAESGQQFPGFGYRAAPDQPIAVVDGSRRRASCLIHEKTYYIYVAKELITAADVRYISKVANIYKPLSLFERGQMYQAMLNDGHYPDAKALAAGEGEHESIVSIALQIVREIPHLWMKCAPSVYDLGRPAFAQLLKLAKNESTKEMVSIYLDMFDARPSDLWELLENKTGTSDTGAMNQAYLEKLQFNSALKVSKKAPPAILASKGKATAVVTKSSKSGFTVQIGGIDDATRGKLEKAIQDVIQGGK